MTSPIPSDGSLVDVRERLARLETKTASHAQGSVDRHEQVLRELRRLAERVEEIETRMWRQALLLVVVAVGGSAGVVPLLKALVGG